MAAGGTDNIRVAIRVRPFIKRESDGKNQTLTHKWKVVDGQKIHLLNNGKPVPNTAHVFDQVFDQTIDTGEIFHEFAKPVVMSAMDGFNGTIFAYGQTSSGKTFTMMGNEQCPGVIPRAADEIFCYINQWPTREFLLRVSYMEIYNEVISDLLKPGNKNLKIHESVEKSVYVGGLTEEMVTTKEQILSVISKGEGHRHFGVTNMNERSSRSHTICQIVIESREMQAPGLNPDSIDGAVRVAHLNLVDLAGSERVAVTGAEGVRLKEGGHINRSLFTLGSVISKLSEGESFIPFRDSKLTRILQSSLGGNAKTSILCTVTPAFIDETLSTLRFASRAKTIKNCPEVNEVLDDGTLLKRYRKEIQQLKKQLEQTGKSFFTEVDLQELKSEREKMAQMLEEKTKQQREQEEKIKRLANMICHAGARPQGALPKASKRRETWCPGQLSTMMPLLPRQAEVTSVRDQMQRLSSSSSSDGSMSFNEIPQEEFLARLEEKEKEAMKDPPGRVASSRTRRKANLHEPAAVAIPEESEHEICELEQQCAQLRGEKDLLEHRLEVASRDLQQSRQELRDLENLHSSRNSWAGPAPSNQEDGKANQKLKQLQFNLELTKQKCEKAEKRAKELENENKLLERAEQTNSCLFEERDVARQRAKEVQDTLTEKTRRIGELGIEVTQLRAHVELLTSEHKKMKAQLEKREREVEDLEQKLCEEQEKLGRHREDASTESSEKKDAEELNAALAKLSKEFRELQSAKEDTQTSLEEKEIEVKTLRALSAKESNEVRELNSTLAVLRKKFGELQAAKGEVEVSLEERESELKQLQELHEDHSYLREENLTLYEDIKEMQTTKDEDKALIKELQENLLVEKQEKQVLDSKCKDLEISQREREDSGERLAARELRDELSAALDAKAALEVKVNKLEEKCSAISVAYEGLQDYVSRGKACYEELQRDLESAKEYIADLEEELAEDKAGVLGEEELLQEQGQLEGLTSEQQEQTNGYTDEIESLEGEMQQRCAEERRLKEIAHEQQNEVDANTAKIKTLEADLQQMKAKQGADTGTQKEVAAENAQLKEQCQAHQETITRMKTETEQDRDEQRRLKGIIDEQRDEIDAYTAKIKSLTADLQQVKADQGADTCTQEEVTAENAQLLQQCQVGLNKEAKQENDEQRRLKEIIAEKQDEVDAYTAKIKTLEADLQQMRAKQGADTGIQKEVSAENAQLKEQCQAHQETIARMKSETEQDRDEQRRLKGIIDEQRDEVDAYTAKIKTLEADLQQMRAKQGADTGTQKEVAAENAQLKEQCQAHQETITRMKSETEQDRDEQRRLKGIIDEQRDEVDANTAKIKTLEADLQQMRAKQGADTGTQKEVAAENAQLKEQCQAHQETITRMKSETEQDRDEQRRLKGIIDEQRDKINAFSAKIKSMEAEWERRHTEEQRLCDIIDGQQDEVDAYTAKIKTLEADLQQMRAKQGADTGTQKEVSAENAQLKEQCQAHQETITRMKTETEQDRDEQRRLKGIIDEQRDEIDAYTAKIKSLTADLQQVKADQGADTCTQEEVTAENAQLLQQCQVGLNKEAKQENDEQRRLKEIIAEKQDEVDAYTAKIKTLEADLQQMRAKQGADTGTQKEVAAETAQLKQQCQAHQETITRMKCETEQDRDEQRRLKGIIDEQRDKINAFSAKIKSMEAEWERRHTEEQRLCDIIDEQQDEVDAYTAKIKTLEADLQQMRAKQGADTGTQKYLAAENAQLKQECQAHQETITRMKSGTEQDRDEQRRLKGIIDEQRDKINAFSAKIKSMEAEWERRYTEEQRLCDIIDEQQDEVDAYTAKIKTLEADLQQMRAKQGADTGTQKYLAAENAQLKQQCQAHQETITRMKSETEQDRDEQRRLKGIIDEQRDEIDAYTAKIKSLTADLQQVKADQGADTCTQEEVTAENAQLVQQCQVGLNKEAKQENDEQRRLKGIIAEKQDKINAFSAKIKSMEAEWERRHTEEQRLCDIIDEQQDEIDAYTAKIRALQAELQQIKAKQRGAGELAAVSKDLEQTRIELADKNMAIAGLQHDLSSLGAKLRDTKRNAKESLTREQQIVASLKAELGEARRTQHDGRTARAPSDLCERGHNAESHVDSLGVVSAVAMYSMKAKMGKLEERNNTLTGEVEKLRKENRTLAMLNTEASNKVKKLSDDNRIMQKELKKFTVPKPWTARTLAPSNSPSKPTQQSEPTPTHIPRVPDENTAEAEAAAAAPNLPQPQRAPAPNRYTDNWLRAEMAHDMFKDKPDVCKTQ